MTIKETFMRITTNSHVTLIIIFLAVLILGTQARADSAISEPRYKAVFSVTEDDQHTWNEVFGNFRNIQRELGPGNIQLELVVYDQAMGMLKDDSLVAEKVGDALADGVKIVACMNSMNAQGLTKDDMLTGISYVQAGIVELIKLQAAGWAYIRP
jgi:hypothetical protein